MWWYNMRQYCATRHDKVHIVRKNTWRFLFTKKSYWLCHQSLKRLRAFNRNNVGCYSVTWQGAYSEFFFKHSGKPPLFSLVFFFIVVVVVVGVYTNNQLQDVYLSLIVAVFTYSFILTHSIKTANTKLIGLHIFKFINLWVFVKTLSHYNSHVFIMFELCSIGSVKSHTLSARSVSLLENKINILLTFIRHLLIWF